MDSSARRTPRKGKTGGRQKPPARRPHTSTETQTLTCVRFLWHSHSWRCAFSCLYTLRPRRISGSQRPTVPVASILCITTISSPHFVNPPRSTLHNIPRRPCISACNPGRNASICSHGSHTALTCNSTSPICNRCPIANPLTSNPSVVTFSRTIPGVSSKTSKVSRSINKTCRFPCGRACAHPSSPRLPALELHATLPSPPAASALETSESLLPPLNLPPPNFVAEPFRYPSETACLQTESYPQLHTPSATQHSVYLRWQSLQAYVHRSLRSNLQPASFPRAALLRRQCAPPPPSRESLFPFRISPDIPPRPSPRTRSLQPSTSSSPASGSRAPPPPALRPDQNPPAPESPAFPDLPVGN